MRTRPPCHHERSPLPGAGSQGGPGMTAEARIAWVERSAGALAIGVGLALRLAAPKTSIVTTRPMLLVAAGVVLLAVGLARDLARIALEGRPVATAPDRHPGELRLCLESTLGLGAVAAGPAPPPGAPGAPRPGAVGRPPAPPARGGGARP